MEIKINHIINSILYPVSILIIIYYIFHWINNNNKLKNVLQEEYQQMENKDNNPYINQNIYNQFNEKNNLDRIKSKNNNNKDNNDDNNNKDNNNDNNNESFVDVFCKEPEDVNKKINEYIDEYSGKVKELTHELGTINNPLVNRLNTEKCDTYFKDRYNLKNLGHYNEDDNDEYETYDLNAKKEKIENLNYPKRKDLHIYGKYKWDTKDKKRMNSFIDKIKESNIDNFNNVKWYNEIEKDLELPKDFNTSTTNDEIIDSRVRSPMDIRTDYIPYFYNCQRPYYECHTRNKPIDLQDKKPYNINMDNIRQELNIEEDYSKLSKEEVSKLNSTTNILKNNISPYNLDDNLKMSKLN